MPKYTCQARCFWRNRLWEPGQSAVLSAEEARLPENAMVAGKCWRAEADAIVPAPATRTDPPPGDPPSSTPPLADPPPGDPPPSILDSNPADTPEGEGTNLRAVMVDLCLKNGVEFRKNASMDTLRKALAERGIIVN